MTTTINGVQYNEVKRKAQAGEKIKVVSAFLSMGEYKNGDVLTVLKPSPLGNCVVTAESENWVNHREYVVLEPVTSADTIVHDGVQYRKVDRPVREGDAFIVPKKSDVDYTAGKVYAITLIDADGDPHFIDDVGDRYYLYSGNYYVLEPVAPQMAQSALSTLESELAATKAKVAEMEAQLAEAKRLKVGDYAKIVDANGHDFKLGEIVEIFETDIGDSVPYRARNLSGTEISWLREHRVVRATDEEITEALRAAEEAKRKAEETAKWAAIGRKVGEFRAGDVVKITEYEYGHYEGTLVTVIECDGDSLEVRGVKHDRLTDFSAGSACVELIAPVESVVNLRAGDAA